MTTMIWSATPEYVTGHHDVQTPCRSRFLSKKQPGRPSSRFLSRTRQNRKIRHLPTLKTRHFVWGTAFQFCLFPHGQQTGAFSDPRHWPTGYLSSTDTTSITHIEQSEETIMRRTKCKTSF